MFLPLLRFEIRYRLKRLSTYVYFALFFFASFFSVASTDFMLVTGRLLVNGPYAITQNSISFLLLGVVVISGIFGPSILRDFQQDTFSMVASRPVGKFAYLASRWLGSFVICAAIFASIPIGILLGSLMPWVDPERLAEFNLWWYLQPYLGFVLVQIFWLGSLFFFAAAISRRLTLVYLQGVLVLGLYELGGVYVLENRDSFDTFWISIFDPIGTLLAQSLTRYWTVAERNTQLLVWTGEVLYNRLLWLGVGSLALAATFRVFSMSGETGLVRWRRRGAKPEEAAAARLGQLHMPGPLTREFGVRGLSLQFLSLFRLNVQTVLRSFTFWAFVLLAAVLAGVTGVRAGMSYGNATWPVTYQMVQAISIGFVMFLVIGTIYAGELVWRQRDVGFEQIHDATPTPTWLGFAAHFSALAGIQAALLVALIGMGIGLQTYLGYTNYELGLYFTDLFLVGYPTLLIYLVLALFAQTMLASKFAAHAVVIGTFVVIPFLDRFGIQSRLYRFGEILPYTYSDMNGYGHFVAGLFWSITYWSAFAGILALMAVLFVRRGTEPGFRARLSEAGRRFRPTGVRGLAAALALVFVAVGLWFFYNTRVLNEYRTARDQRQQQADYETNYRQYFLAPQPKVTGVEVEVDIYPERRSFEARGSYQLVNREDQPIEVLHVSAPAEDAIRRIDFDRPVELEMEDDRLRFSIYRLEQPLAPGETLRLEFDVAHEPSGFREGGERPDLAYNGTFFDSSWFPSIGYQSGRELTDPIRRRQLGLDPLEDMPDREDPRVRDRILFTPNSDWITFRATVSTSPDQIAIAPGYLTREWTEEGRRYFEYDMGETRMLDFYSFLSGRYEVLRDEHDGVAIEIFYHPGHEYNLDKMMDSVRTGLDYFTESFGPYQFDQFRIIEFPRYRGFAQSFPNTVPYSEAIGFIMRMEDPDEDVDMAFYVTAHELAHQWWAHQLIGRTARGSNMLSESLAQYSALMVMARAYGENQIRKYLRYELDRYLQGRGTETREEPPLVDVQREQYVWYQKASLVMYALQDYIGEEQVNSALRRFVEERGFASENLPTSVDFVEYLREVTPAEMQYLLEDMFETITLYDNRAVSATVTPQGDQFSVELSVDSRKLRSDGLGIETEIEMDDLVDIGVFAGDVNDPVPLVLEKRRVSGTTTDFTFLLDEEPTWAGIDPYHKLIDRNPVDNWMTVSRE